MKKVFILFVFLVAITSSANAWEINTHRAIDKKAAEQSINLKKFVKNAQIENEDYGSERFEGYGNHTYFSYATGGETNGISQWDQNFTDTKYQSLIEAGAILEDAQWPHPPDLPDTLDQADGRFVNHFYDAQVEDNVINMTPDEHRGLFYAGILFPDASRWVIFIGKIGTR